MAMRGGEKRGQQLKTIQRSRSCPSGLRIKDNFGSSQIKQMEQSHAGGE